MNTSMKIDAIHIVVDAGLFVLIWMVQLIVYPSFKYYKKEDLFRWHTEYTSRIAVIVIPLMFGQLGIVIFKIFQNQNLINISNMILVSLVWLITFAKFVPMHSKINEKQITSELLNQLVTFNWSRTIIWTLILFINLFFS